MDRSKFVAIATGAIAVILSLAYLLFVQLLDFRGEMIPAPQSMVPQPTPIAQFVAQLDRTSCFSDALL